ncbi:hypothetical protein RI844_09755 [Thalassotalea fonticola]|uniref:Uncharacterized protein n=1 Tax=Thalassotalea fonticola TaxID=3065649 RepID=A0ABZ0GU53_9GAMM|nr:hypothetical protein RI844_09755 [Colwelliaceae bacterium S1-1]
MKNLSTILMTVLLFISTSVFAAETADKAAQKQTADYVQVVNLNKDEEAKVYQVLLEKEQQYSAAKKEHKGDKQALKAATKPLNKKYNRQIKDIIGADKMKKMNEYKKAQKAANKK